CTWPSELPMGCWPDATSMIARRRCPNAAKSSTKKPSPSGPRWAIVSAMLWMRSRACWRSWPPKSTNPVIPHTSGELPDDPSRVATDQHPARHLLGDDGAGRHDAIGADIRHHDSPLSYPRALADRDRVILGGGGSQPSLFIEVLTLAAGDADATSDHHFGSNARMAQNAVRTHRGPRADCAASMCEDSAEPDVYLPGTLLQSAEIVSRPQVASRQAGRHSEHLCKQREQHLARQHVLFQPGDRNERCHQRDTDHEQAEFDETPHSSGPHGQQLGIAAAIRIEHPCEGELLLESLLPVLCEALPEAWISRRFQQHARERRHRPRRHGPAGLLAQDNLGIASHLRDGGRHTCSHRFQQGHRRPFAEARQYEQVETLDQSPRVIAVPGQHDLVCEATLAEPPLHGIEHGPRADQQAAD